LLADPAADQSRKTAEVVFCLHAGQEILITFDPCPNIRTASLDSFTKRVAAFEKAATFELVIVQDSADLIQRMFACVDRIEFGIACPSAGGAQQRAQKQQSLDFHIMFLVGIKFPLVSG
jgi:hypothetical protein